MPTGKHMLWDAYVTIAGNDVSDHIRSVQVNRAANELQATAMGALAEERRQGIRNDNFTMTAYNDYGAAELHAILEPLFEAGTAFTVVVRPSQTEAVSATNPQFVGSCLLLEYSGLSGEHGEMNMSDLTFPTYSGTIHEETTATYS